MPELRSYGARMVTTEGRATVEMRDPNDNAHARYQYRRTGDGGLERRVLRADGTSFGRSGSPWERVALGDLLQMMAARGHYHPILDPLGF